MSGGAGFVRISDVRRVVKNCSQHGVVELRTHRWVVEANGKKAFLDKGAHKPNPEIRLRKVLHAFAQLELDEECVRKHL